MLLRTLLVLSFLARASAAAEPTRLDWRPWAVGFGAFGGLYLLDEQIRDEIQERRKGTDRLTGFWADEPIRVETVGIFTTGFLAAAWFRQDERARRVATVLPQAWVLNYFATNALKKLVGRHRPFLGEGTHEFTHWTFDESQKSFPSGHTSIAFSVAASIATEYDTPWVDVPAYGMAAFVGYTRLHDDFHWATDVVGGAAVGILTAKALHHLYRKPTTEWGLLPSPNGVIVTRRF